MQEGDSSDPFVEADRREREQRKAEKARSHAALTFHSPAQPQAAAPSTSAPQLTYGATSASSAPATGQMLDVLYMSSPPCCPDIADIADIADMQEH